MPSTHRILHIEPLAPPKPVPGAPCNGCGVCCLAEPCPLGMVISRRRNGACDALRWNSITVAYRCGVLEQPLSVARASLPPYLRLLAPGLARMFALFGRRWIAAGQGCDSSLEAQAPVIRASPFEPVPAASTHRPLP